jgi:oligopeptide transport system substrate-binding protein
MRVRVALLSASFLFLLSCSSENRDSDKRTVFNYNEINGITSLDPAAAAYTENIWAINQLFNGLLEMDDSLHVQPAIAHQYSISHNAKVYSFTLRNDVYFHDDECFAGGRGRRVTANDFYYSFKRLYDTKISSATSLLEKIERFEAVNDSVFRVHMKTPFSAFLNILTMKYFSVVPHEAVRKYGDDFRKHPVGTGPFMFRSWDEGQKLIMVKNDRYFEFDKQNRRLPYLDAVTVSFIRDRETGFMELLSGRFDMLSGADAFNTNEVLDRSGNLWDVYTDKFYLQKETYLKTDYIGILVEPDAPELKKSPLRHKALRQAINYGFDRIKLTRYLRNNLGVPATSGFIPKGMRSYDTSAVKGYSYNPEKVRQLLREAGFPDGKGLPEMTLHVSDIYREQVEFIQSQLARNNIRVQISIEKASVLREAVNRGEFLLFKKSWLADYADEENFFSLFYSRNFSPAGVNYFHYKNQRFDSLYERSLEETDETLKKKMYQEMDRLVTEDAPVITLYYDEVVRLVSKKISGFETNPMNLLKLKTVIKASK